MATYLTLNLIFLIGALIVLRPWQLFRRKAWWVMLFVLVTLTVIFDNVMIFFDLFTYATDKITGLRIGLAPVEDLSYSVLAAILLPALWNRIGDKHEA